MVIDVSPSFDTLSNKSFHIISAVTLFGEIRDDDHLHITQESRRASRAGFIVSTSTENQVPGKKRGKIR